MGVQRVSCDRQMDLVNVILDKDATSEHLGSSGLNKTQAPPSLQRTVFALHGRERRQQFTFELCADLSVILWAGHIMRCKSHGYADEEEKTNRSAS
ncbi:hypothetical protein, partial [Burkholderia cenocepacia]|uniref:hypothetical protein n=1 Tax=Burkholderia cenocepacia TaxID=95486 RepID=UPI001ABADC71